MTLRRYIKACQLRGNGRRSLHSLFSRFLIIFNMPFRACYHGLCHANVRNRPDILFHAFPRPAENDPVQIYECHQWIKACGRQPSDLNFNMITEDFLKPSRSRKYFVCADHFVDKKPTPRRIRTPYLLYPMIHILPGH